LILFSNILKKINSIIRKKLIRTDSRYWFYYWYFTIYCIV